MSGWVNQKSGKQIVDSSRQVMRTLMDYSWPGNIRELENAIEHAFVLCKSDRIQLEDLPIEIRQVNLTGVKKTRMPLSDSIKRQKLTKKSLLKLLDDCEWNKAEVGRQAGLSRTAIWKYMKKWNIPLQRDP